jgi:hypothetical protein
MLSALSSFSSLKKNFASLENQSLFVLQELFVKAGSFREDLSIMEDQEFIKRLKRYASFIVLKDKVVASTRKYLTNGIARMELTSLLTRIMYKMGCSQEKLMKAYNWMLGRKTTKTKTQDTPLSALFN